MIITNKTKNSSILINFKIFITNRIKELESELENLHFELQNSMLYNNNSDQCSELENEITNIKTRIKEAIYILSNIS